jgi:hypothetical protein
MVKSSPTQKEVVVLLCKYLREDTIQHQKKNGVVVDIKQSVYQCPKLECTCVNREIVVWKGSGFSNPHTHLLSCVAGGDPAKLSLLYEDNLKRKRNSEGLGNHFMPIATPVTDREKAMYGWIRLIATKNLPLTAAEDKEFRDFTKYTSFVSTREVRATMLTLVELVETEKSSKFRMSTVTTTYSPAK